MSAAPPVKLPKAPVDYSNLDPHPLSTIFHPMEVEALTALGEDITLNGLREPIWLFDDHILDGNNRYRACVKTKRGFKQSDFRVFDPTTQGDPLTFVVSANLHRRHLTESQRAAIAAALVTSKLGYNQYNRATVTNEQAAKLLGVSEAIVKMAKKVAEKAAPEIVEAVRKGELRLGAAMPLLKVAKEQQAAELAKNKAEAAKAKADAEAARATAKAGKPKQPKANQEMTDLDDFRAKWRGFNEMQRKAFVMSFEEELAGLLEYVRQQKAMTGGGVTANAA